MMTGKTHIDDLSVAECNAIVAEENLVVDVQFLLQDALVSRGLTRTELAALTGVSKARLSQLMSSEANPTLRTVARLFAALDCKLEVAVDRKCAVDSPDRYTEESWSMLNTQPIKKKLRMSEKRAEAMLAYAVECGNAAEANYVANDNFALMASNYAVMG